MPSIIQIYPIPSGHNSSISSIEFQSRHSLCPCYSKTKSGWTSLHFAAKNGHDGLVDYLIRKKSAVVDSMTMKKQTPLHFAATNGQVQVWFELFQTLFYNSFGTM